MQSGLFCFRGQNKKLTVWGLCRDNESEYGCRQSVSSSACMWDSLLCFLIRCDHKWWQRTDNYLQQIGIFDLPVCVYYDEDASVASFIHKTNWGGVGGGALCTLIRSLSLKHRGCARLLPCLWIIEAIQLSGTVYACHFKPNTSQETTLPTRPDRPWCREINLSLFLFQIKYLLALKLCVFLRLTMSSSDWLAGYLFWRRHACHGMCRSQSSERSMMFAVIL